MKWSKKRAISLSVIAAIGISIILSIIGNQEAHAETVTFDIPYGQQFSGGFQAVYSKDSTKNVTLDVPNKNGKIISKVVLMKDGVEYQSYPEAIGQTSWNKSVTLTGEAIPLVTDNTGGTDSAKGYYAWYRYAQGDPRAPDWFSDIGGTIYLANNGPADTIYPGMTENPGISSTSLGVELTLSGNRVKPFKVVSTGTQWFDEASVDSNPSKFSTTVNKNALVTGPGTVPDGYPDGSTQYISTSGDINNFTVHYNQTFGESDYKTDLGLPGAAMTIYYAAFNVIIHTNTYKYPDKLVITYDDAPVSPSPSPTPSPTPTPDNGPEVITGDFTLGKTVMNFGESNAANPVNVKVSGGNGSKLVEFGFTFTQGSLNWSDYGPKSSPAACGFFGPPYPAGMGGGTVNVTMKIKTSLGTEKIVGPKSFEIVIPPNNNPPVWKGAWFQGGNSYGYPPITQVLLGDYVDLGIVNDPTETPNTPYDPDGDDIIYTWDFAGSSDPWIQAIGDKTGGWTHDEHISLIKADVLGIHTVKVSAIDRRGASGGSQNVTIEVMDPNAPPIPVITLPPKVVEGRTFTPDISGANSYSPIIGRTIKTYSWTGKQAMYPTAGTYPITLSVTDSAGIQSEYPAVKDLVVQPDLPPIPRLDNPGFGIRNSPIYFKDTSYSPDDDPIAIHTTELAYDSNNDGSFADEPYSPITLDGSGNFTYTASKVGKYDIKIYLKEGLGYQRDATGHFGFEVVNDAPEADYYIEGSDFSPPIVQTLSYSASTLLNDANWKASNVSTGTVRKSYIYNSAENALETPKGQSVPYKSITSSNLILTKKDWNGTDWYYYRDFGLSKMITPNLFLNGRTSFTNLNFTNGSFVPYPLTIPNGNFYTDIMELDVENDKVWFKGYYHNVTFDYITFNDNVFRISDIMKESLMGRYSNYRAQPIYSRDTKYNSPGPNVSSPPLPADVWTSVPEKKSDTGQNVALPYKYITYGNKVESGTNRYNKSPYGSDHLGNTYRWYGDVNSGNHVYFQKLSPAGDVIWSHLYKSFPPNNTWNHYWNDVITAITNTSTVISYISDDNSKIVLMEGTDGGADYGASGGYRVLDNTTGNVIYQSDANTSNSKLHNDKVISFFTVKEQKTRYNYQPFSQYIHYFDLKTNTANTVKLFTYDVDYDGGNTTPGAKPKFLITADEKITVYKNQYLRVLDMQGNVVASMDGLYQKGNDEYDTDLFYNGDGRLVISTGYDNDSRSSGNYLYILKSDSDPAAKLNGFGQFSNTGVSLSDGEVSAQIKLNYDNFTTGVSAGLSARIQDNQNMYRMEVTSKTSRLVKIVNGNRTVLQEVNYPLNYRTYYDVKLKLNGSRIKGYIGGVPLLDVTDTAFASGLVGPYSEIEYSLLKGFSVTKYQSNEGTTKNTAIVGTALNTVKSYSDTENDPAIDPLTRWTYTHTNANKFLDAGDGYSGLSAYHGQTVTAPKAVLDKVGEYKLDYQVCDDPGPPGFKFPNDTFAGYRKYSDVASHSVIIHRRPIAVFSLFLNADNTVGWNDTSYDPDRWLSSSNYSTEATGINYQATRGIVGRKMNFTTPSGETRDGQLIKPDQTGTYTVRLAVKDEYGAWSDWAETTINISIPIPNNKPTAALTFPDGTQANPSYVSLKPTLTWNQSDPDPGTIFTQFEVRVKDEYGNTYESKTSNYYTINPSWSWTLDNPLDPGKKYWAQVRVWDDGGLASDWTNIGWMMTNTPPTASMADPNGTQENPTIVSATRPTFTWNQTDPDPGNTFTQAEIEVTNEANTITLYNKIFGQWTSQTWNSFQADQDLPAGQKLRVRVRVWDNQGAASNWSAQTWFMINRAPVADFDWSPKPVWEGDTVQLTNLSSDPDGDSLAYLWEITGPDGLTVSFNTTDITRGFLLPGPYTVKLTVSDGLTSSQATKVITAQPLTILSDVEHTPEWLANHQKLQHNTTIRPKDFYSGEIFVVHTQSSPAPVTRAEAWIDTIGLDGNELKINTVLAQSVNDNTLFTGEIFDERLLSLTEGLPKGNQMIHFRITYANGVIKEEDVPVTIIGNVREFVQVHRVQ